VLCTFVRYVNVLPSKSAWTVEFKEAFLCELVQPSVVLQYLLSTWLFLCDVGVVNTKGTCIVGNFVAETFKTISEELQ